MKPAAPRHLQVSGTVSILVLILGVAWVVIHLLNPPYVHVTDLGRDLIGARAVVEGISPYQRLGDIADQVPGIEVPAYAESYWVAHSPFSIALARLLWGAAGEDSETVARVAVIASVVVLMAASTALSKTSKYVRVLLAGALAFCFGTSVDIFWLNGASLLALGLGISLFAAAKEKRALALAILGICVAWRPWCAPLVVVLPRSTRPLRDVAWVGAIAAAITSMSVPFIGGWPALTDWLRVIPLNTDENILFEWNSSLTARPIGGLASLALLGVLTLVLASDRIVSRAGAPTALSLGILAFTPLVWPPHWVGLYPALLYGRSDDDAVVLAFTLLLIANPLAGSSSTTWRVVSLMSVVLLAGWLLLNERRGHDVRLCRTT